MCDRDRLLGDTVAIDLSLGGAWRRWQYKHRFPQVDTDLGRGYSGFGVIVRADERKHTLNFFWGTEGQDITICARPLWSGGQVDANQAAQLIDGDVPATGWQQLAEDLLRRFDARVQQVPAKRGNRPDRSSS